MREFGKRTEVGSGVVEEWRELRGRIKGAIEKMEKGWEGGGGGGWWDEECREEKRKVRKELRRWRREGGKGENIG